MSSLFTLDEVNQICAALKDQLIADPMGTIGTVSLNGRSVSYRSVDELLSIISFWSRYKASLERVAAGTANGISASVAKFS